MPKLGRCVCISERRCSLLGLDSPQRFEPIQVSIEAIRNGARPRRSRPTLDRLVSSRPKPPEPVQYVVAFGVKSAVPPELREVGYDRSSHGHMMVGLARLTNLKQSEDAGCELADVALFRNRAYRLARMRLYSIAHEVLRAPCCGVGRQIHHQCMTRQGRLARRENRRGPR
jgi:hypothetical protein